MALSRTPEYKPDSRNTVAGKSLLYFMAIVALFLLHACSQKDSDAEGAATAAKLAAAAGTTNENPGLRRIVLPHDEPEFPPGKGREIFISRCTVCHSLRYVTMQPDLSQEHWQKEVEKMRHNYGAHITDDEAKEIVGYLMLVRGKKK